MNIAVYPGSFNPIHPGHFEVIRQATYLFDKVIILILDNPEKEYKISWKERLELISNLIEDESWKEKVEVQYSNESLVTYLDRRNIDIVIRGIRNASDLEYEKVLIEYNDALLYQKANIDEIHTVLIPTYNNYNHFSSYIKQFVKYATFQQFRKLYATGWSNALCDSREEPLRRLFSMYGGKSDSYSFG